MLNICMVGHGMMGVWHSEALQPRERSPTAHRRRPPAAPGGTQRPDAGRRSQTTVDRNLRQHLRLQEVDHRPR